MTSPYPHLDPLTDRRVALITGGNSGVGYYTVLHLYLHGYIIYIAGRLKSRVMKLIKELKSTASSLQTTYPLGELHYLEIDFIDLNSVKFAVQKFKNLEYNLHLLINNAGTMNLPYEITKDNFEIQLQINYIAPFYLTTLLLPILERSFTPDSPPRIINLSSIGHKLFLKYHFSLSTNMNYYPNFLFTWIRYSRSKIIGIHYTKMLSLRNPKILSISIHPGLIMNTNIFTYWTRLPIIGTLFWIWFQILALFISTTPEQGASCVLKYCLDPKLSLEHDNGKYFSKTAKSSPSSLANDMDYAARSWIWTVTELTDRGFVIRKSLPYR